MRLRLVADEDADVPKSLNNIVVSIHAIATFQALHDYLRPRVSGLLSSSSRLSTMLAALTAATSGSPPASSSRTVEQPTPVETSGGAASTSGASGDGSRRRSLRLSAKNTTNEETESNAEPEVGQSADGNEGPSVPAPVSESAKSHETAELAPSETLVNDEAEFGADFTDDEVDADVRT